MKRLLPVLWLCLAAALLPFAIGVGGGPGAGDQAQRIQQPASTGLPWSAGITLKELRERREPGPKPVDGHDALLPSPTGTVPVADPRPISVARAAGTPHTERPASPARAPPVA